ncbi:hypothetical protein, conserved [Eimeria maxima]|uniref:Uncharacterized protein n=1 Tax=Eimeria maxima TaxID=5804 RepID=U6M7A6_EIMMA|nr:hypothetical protein, conserved [Eimeria maxima]CDJ58953.1 hypothetical protein, conserved [Eimeria maxima]
MAGRAGRRGIDPHGSVYIFAPDELPPLKALATLPAVNCIYGEPPIRKYAEMQREFHQLGQKVHLKVWQNRQISSSIFTLGRVVYVHSIDQTLPYPLPAVILNVDFIPLVPGDPPTFTSRTITSHGGVVQKGSICLGAPWAPPGGPYGSSTTSIVPPLGAPHQIDIEDIGRGDEGLGSRELSYEATAGIACPSSSSTTTASSSSTATTTASSSSSNNNNNNSSSSSSSSSKSISRPLNFIDILPKLDIDIVDIFIKYNEV